MLSPKDITQKRFEKGFGYKADEVDAFLKEVAVAYSTALKEAEESEEKILKLVERINQYRADEDAIKEAFISAQKQANRIIAEANEEAERLSKDAVAESERIAKEAKDKADEAIKEQTQRTQQVIEATKIQYAAEHEKLDNVRLEVSNFKAQLTELYNKQLRLIMEIPEVTEEDLAKMVEERKAVNTAAVVETEESEPLISETAEPVKEQTKSSESKYGELKFGMK